MTDPKLPVARLICGLAPTAYWSLDVRLCDPFLLRRGELSLFAAGCTDPGASTTARRLRGTVMQRPRIPLRADRFWHEQAVPAGKPIHFEPSAQS
jgi:hypothetical protein